MDSTESGATNKALRENLQDLQDLVIRQASRLINDNLYTKSLLSSLPVALISTDKKGLIQVANRAAEEMLQTQLQSVKGSPLNDLFAFSPAIAEKINQARDQQAPVSADSLDLILADGQQKVVNASRRKNNRQFAQDEAGRQAVCRIGQERWARSVFRTFGIGQGLSRCKTAQEAGT
jgi:nitrogen fixation/metabolism regulation signal transduction histidine kinase